MSEVKVNKVSPRSGTGVQLGDSGDTITIPSGATILNSGTASGFGDNLEWQSSIVTAATITVTANKGYWLDTSSNAITVTLPGSASVGDRLIFTDYARNWATNNVTINQNSLKFQGFASPNPVYDTNGQSVDIVYSGTTKGWIPNSDDDVTNEVPQTASIEYLVVAGGGSAGSGGGGGGGMRNATTTFNQGTVLTATIGAGGVGTYEASGNNGTNGGDSSLAGSGFTTFTSTGGGYGAINYGNDPKSKGSNGGAGGGAGRDGTGTNYTGGSGNTPSTSPSQGAGGGNGGSGGYGVGGSGGGGGASGVAGSNGRSPTAPGTLGMDGGNGTQSSITGSAVYYAGGGASGSNLDPPTSPLSPAPSGGQGGGGDGSVAANAAAGGDGTANLGGGGGGSDQPAGTTRNANGGSGVVILSVADADYSGTTSGSPTVTTGVSGKTIIKFTGTGTYTV